MPAAYLVLLRGSGPATEVLLQLRGSGAGYMADHWACGAAGHIEYGESVAVAAAREAAEELGIAVEPDAVTALCALQRSEPGNPDPVEQRVDFFVTARRWSGEPAIQEPEKCQELRWCPLTDLPEPLVPHESVVLQALSRGEVPAFLSIGF